MFRGFGEFLLSPFLLLFLSAIRVYLELIYTDVVSEGAFFFSKLWFYSLLCFADLKVAERIAGAVPKVVIIPFMIFVPSVFLDTMFFFRDFDRGIPLLSFHSSLFSFFFLSRGVPKFGLIIFFIIKFFLLIFSLRRGKDILSSFLYFLISYFIWQIAHIDIIYGKLSFLFFFFSERSAYILSGVIFMVIFLFVFFRSWFVKTALDGIKKVELPYIFLLSLLGHFSSGYGEQIKIIISFMSLLGFYFLHLFFLRLKDFIEYIRSGSDGSGYDQKKRDELIFLIFIIFSLFSMMRGIFVVPLPIFVFFFAIYHLPPLSLGARLVGFPLFGLFSSLMFLLSHLAPKSEFFIVREAVFIALAVFIFSSLEYITLRIRDNLNLRRVFAFLTSLSPISLMHAPEDIVFILFFALASARFINIRWIRFISAAYFVSKYSYMKKLMEDILIR